MTQQVTQVGLNATANAKVSGFKIAITKFAVTEAPSVTPLISDVGLAGIPVYSGDIAVIDVLTGAAAVEFTCEVPLNVPATGTWKLGEIGLYLESGELFSHGPMEPIYTKDNSFGIRFIVIVALADLGDVINVSLTNTNSIPAVAYVRSLPKPAESFENAIAVLDQWQNTDVTDSPSIAIKYGPGGTRWGYMGFDRAYEGFPDLVIDANTFKADPIAHGFLCEIGETVIVQEVIMGNSGHSHKYLYEGSGIFSLVDSTEDTSGIAANSTIGIWRRIIPMIASGVKLSIKRHSLTTNAAGFYPLDYAPQRDEYVMIWVDGLYQEADLINGNQIYLAGPAAGLPLEIAVLVTSKLESGDDPDYLQIDQQDFDNVAETALHLSYAPESRDWVMLFRNGRQMLPTEWDLFGQDVTLLSAADADMHNYQVVVLRRITAAGGYSFGMVHHNTTADGKRTAFPMAGLSATSGYVMFGSGLLQQKEYWTVDYANSELDTAGAVFPASIPLNLVQFQGRNTGYFFATETEVGNLFEQARFGDHNLLLTRHNGKEVSLPLPSNVVVVPVGEAYGPSKFPEGLTGLDAYNSTDMPVLSGSHAYYAGLTEIYNARGMQMAVCWDRELDVPKSFQVRVKDDTQQAFGQWRRVAWYDELVAAQIPLTVTDSNPSITTNEAGGGQTVVSQITSGVPPYALSVPGSLPQGLTSVTLVGTNIFAVYRGAGAPLSTNIVPYIVTDSDGARSVSKTFSFVVAPMTDFTLATDKTEVQTNTVRSGSDQIAHVSSGTGPYVLTSAPTIPGLTLAVDAAGLVTATYDGSVTGVSSSTVAYTLTDPYGRTAQGSLTYTVSTAVLPAATMYSTPGTYSYTVPDGVFRVQLLGEGGGGSGGTGAWQYWIKTGTNSVFYGSVCAGGGGGGGAGTEVITTIDVVPGDVLAVVVGAGGARNVSTYSVNTINAPTQAGQSAIAIFADGNDGSPSYVSKAGNNVVYCPAGSRGKGGQVALVSVTDNTGPYGQPNSSHPYVWMRDGALGGIGGAGGSLNGATGGSTTDATNYGGKGGKGGDSVVAQGGAGGQGGVAGGSGSPTGVDGSNAVGLAAGGGGGGGDGSGASYYHSYGGAGGSGWITVHPTN